MVLVLWAPRSPTTGYHSKVAKYLVRHGADVMDPQILKTALGNTMVFAARSGNILETNVDPELVAWLQSKVSAHHFNVDSWRH